MNSTLKPVARIKSGALTVEVTDDSMTISVTGENEEEGVAEVLLSLNQFAEKLSSSDLEFKTRDRKVPGGRNIDCIIFKL